MLTSPPFSRVRVAFALLAAVSSLAPAQEKPALPAPTKADSARSDRFGPLDVFQVQFPSAPQISPDGKRVVYVRAFADIMSDRRLSNLWIIGADGTGHRALTAGNFTDAGPVWSPDGTRLAYVSDRDGSPQIYVRWVDSGETAKLTALPNAPTGLAWSPDGTRLAFASFVPGTKPKVDGMPAAPEGAKWADAPVVHDRLMYRFNARGYLKPGFSQLFIVAADGGAPRQLTTGDFPFGETLFGGSTPVWTPDGKHLLLSGNLRTDFEYDPLNSEVYEISVADGSFKPLTTRQGPDGAPAVSPDGRLIAFTGFDDRRQGHQTTLLSVMNRDGSNVRVLTPKLDRDVQTPAWAPDGKSVFFLYDDQGDTHLGSVTLEGKFTDVAHLLSCGGSSYSGGGSFTVAKGGTIALTFGNGAVPGEVAVLAATDKTPRVLTALNRELLTQKKLGEVDEIWCESSVDQRKVHAWIIKPPGFDPAKKYPLILEIHGGPFTNYGAHFDTVKQIWAGKGYVVVYVNPRGSTSYGEEFANLIHHKYPGDDFFDLDSAVDAVIAKGFVDKDNCFITGGSGGGVLTCWSISRTERYRAAASLYPVINWFSWTLTSDLPAFGSMYWFPGPPWEQSEHYMQRSVITHVGKVKTPTLLMTGEEDWRTPISEAEQYYSALKLRKIETVLVRVPTEPHGIQRRPSHQIAKALYPLDWFEKHKLAK